MNHKEEKSSKTLARTQPDSQNTIALEHTRDSTKSKAKYYNSITYLLKIMKNATLNLLQDNCLRYSAALSFYALFSIAPIIFLSIYVADLLASDVDFQQQITSQFSQLIGERGAKGIDLLMNTLNQQEQSRFQLTMGIAILIFSATNIFVQIQLAFNEIYLVRAKAGAGIIKKVMDRLISLGIIFSLGFLLIISLMLDSIVFGLNYYLSSVLNDAAIVVVAATQYLLLIVLVMSVIYSLFHFLPDVTLPNRYKISGSLAVTFMLLLGKYGISRFIASSNLGELGGASASVIVLMLWIYYSSIILFFGAEIIKAMAEIDQKQLEPRRYATRFRTIVVEN